jgi:hypothetical protein
MENRKKFEKILKLRYDGDSLEIYACMQDAFDLGYSKSEGTIESLASTILQMQEQLANIKLVIDGRLKLRESNYKLATPLGKTVIETIVTELKHIKQLIEKPKSIQP